MQCLAMFPLALLIAFFRFVFCLSVIYQVLEGLPCGVGVELRLGDDHGRPRPCWAEAY